MDTENEAAGVGFDHHRFAEIGVGVGSRPILSGLENGSRGRPEVREFELGGKEEVASEPGRCQRKEGTLHVCILHRGSAAVQSDARWSVE